MWHVGWEARTRCCRDACSFLRSSLNRSSFSCLRSGFFSTLVLLRRFTIAFSRCGTRILLTCWIGISYVYGLFTWVVSPFVGLWSLLGRLPWSHPSSGSTRACRWLWCCLSCCLDEGLVGHVFRDAWRYCATFNWVRLGQLREIHHQLFRKIVPCLTFYHSKINMGTWEFVDVKLRSTCQSGSSCPLVEAIPFNIISKTLIQNFGPTYQISSSQPNCIKSSSVSSQLRNATWSRMLRTLKLILTNVDISWWIDHVGSEVVHHLGQIKSVSNMNMTKSKILMSNGCRFVWV